MLASVQSKIVQTRFSKRSTRRFSHAWIVSCD